MSKTLAVALRPLTNRLRRVVSRAVLFLVNDALEMQTLQVKGAGEEVSDNVEHWQPYGFTAVPLSGAEVLMLSVGGDRAHPVAISAADRRYRIADGEPGEVCIYTLEDTTESSPSNAHRVHFKNGRIIELKAGDSSIVMTPTSITITTPQLDIN